MKEFKCKRCGKYLGEMSKGKLHKDAIILCNKCKDFYETCESLSKYNKGMKEPKGASNYDINNMFGDIFGKNNTFKQ